MNKETTKKLAEALVPEQYKKATHFCVMLFFQARDLGMEAEGTKPEDWINTRNIDFENGQDALDYYANTSCPASQLIEANSKEELERKKKEMIDNYHNESWLNNELYSYL